MIGGIKQVFIFLIVIFGFGNQLAAFQLSQEIDFSKSDKEFASASITISNHTILLDNSTKKKSNTKDKIVVVDSVLNESPRKKRSTKGSEVKPKMEINVWEVHPTSLRKDISKYLRIEQGNSVSTNSYAINDRLSPNSIANMVSFNMYDKKLNVHSFSGTQSTMFPLNFTYENNVNKKLDLLGFEYRFKTNEAKKLRYSGRVRLEQDNEQQKYYQFGLGINWKKEKRGHTFEIEHFPVRSGSGHILKIYRTQIASYNEVQLNTHLKQIAIIESNYYSDEHIDVTLVTRTEYDIVATSVFKVSPLIELGYGEGTINRRDSYPYWMARRRSYGGGGVAFALGSQNSKFQMIADASIFAEISQASFERYTGNLLYTIKKFATLHAGFEVYTIENFYSNVAQLGMVYNFK